jgi:hypothetical protein
MPSGEVLCLKAEECKNNYINKVIESWKEQNPEYTDELITGGFIEISMPEEKYVLIPTTNSFIFPET